jgi:hypothetical protein
MTRPQLEIADIFRHHGQQWCDTPQGHVSLSQLKVMSAIENCRTPVLGGHILRCQACDHIHISYNSCRNRHCPKCQASSAKGGLKLDKRNCCRWIIITWCSLCLKRLPI